MRLTARTNFKLSFLLLSGFLGSVFIFSAATAQGYENYNDYLDALKVADRYVQKKKTASANRMGALSTAPVKELFGRYYQVGDSWDVAAVRIDPDMMPGATADKISAPAFFHYQVSRVTSGLNPEIEIQITQAEQVGVKIVDPKVKSVVILLSDQFKERSKKYTVVGSEQIVTGSIDGLGGNFSGLEFFPLDVPDLASADRSQPVALPEIPGALKKTAAQNGFKVDLSQSRLFDHEDFFGRSVQALWQMGDPWPAMIRTPHGFALLIRKGT